MNNFRIYDLSPRLYPKDIEVITTFDDMVDEDSFESVDTVEYMFHPIKAIYFDKDENGLPIVQYILMDDIDPKYIDTNPASKMITLGDYLELVENNVTDYAFSVYDLDREDYVSAQEADENPLIFDKFIYRIALVMIQGEDGLLRRALRFDVSNMVEVTYTPLISEEMLPDITDDPINATNAAVEAEQRAKMDTEMDYFEKVHLQAQEIADEMTDEQDFGIWG